MRVAVHVTPRASRDEISGWRGGELSVRVTAPPDGGRANAAVCSVVAQALGLPRSAVRVVLGHTSRHKRLEVDGRTDDDIRLAFGEPPEPLF
jgi:hypothetical protein